jgi:hypothetical protein
VNKSQLIENWVRPAFYIDEQREWYGYPKKHSLRTYHVERYIWREEDIPLYRVALGETLHTDMTHTNPTHQPIETRILEYVPTGKIMYVHEPLARAVLFEYRLKEARDTR